MVTSSLIAKGGPLSLKARSPLRGRRLERRALKTVIPGALLLSLLLMAATSAYCLDIAGGVAIPRGFYDYAAAGYDEFRLYRGALPPYVSVNGRVSAYGAYRDQIGLLVGSASLLVKVTTPSPLSGGLGLKPYVSAGPSFNYLYSWADLGDFGTLSKTESSATTSVFVGADFFSASKVALFVEARETIRSDFTFDYVLIGLKYVGPVLPDIE